MQYEALLSTQFTDTNANSIQLIHSITSENSVTSKEWPFKTGLLYSYCHLTKRTASSKLEHLIRKEFRTNPIGCPKLTAPPWMFTLEGSRSHSLILARTTPLKASLTSIISMLSLLMPVCSNSFGMARPGAMGKSMGCVAASANVIIRARGFTPCFSAAFADIRTRAHPPSFSLLEFKAVMVPGGMEENKDTYTCDRGISREGGHIRR